MNFHGTYKRTSMAHINELPWHISTNFHGAYTRTSMTSGVISRHTLKQLCNHMLTSTYNTTLYYKLNTHVVKARWSLTRPTTELSSNTLTCSLRNYQTQTEYYTKIPRLYVAQYLRCESEPSAKHYVLSAEKACRLQLYNYL